MPHAASEAQRQITYVALDSVAGAVRNPKAHDIEGIRASIGRFGLVAPSVLDERTGRLVAGHGRLAALQAMREAGEGAPAGVRLDSDGAWLVPLLTGWASRSDAEADAYLIADNQWTVRGGWDEADLGDFLDAIGNTDPDLLAATGFTDDDLASLLNARSAGAGGGSEQDDEQEYAPAPGPAITEPGDIWELGPHRLICGDCRDPATLAQLMAGARAVIAFTSPPYASQRAYDASSGFTPIRPDDYVEWFADVQACVRSVLDERGSWFVNIKEHASDGQRVLYVKDLTLAHVRRWGWRFVDELAWVHNGLPGTWDNRHKNQWEPVFHYSASRELATFQPDANAVESVDAFTYAGKLKPAATGNPISWSGTDVDRQEGTALPGNVVHVGKSHAAVAHEAVFPVALPAWFLRAYSEPGASVLDPFMGSGSTLIAAHREGRIAYGVEISPAYCDVICRRWQRETGLMPQRNGQPIDFERGDDDGQEGAGSEADSVASAAR